MRIVFAGTPQVAIPSLELLTQRGHEVLAVVTRPDAPVGRSRRPVPSPVATAARELGIPVLTPARPRDPDFVAELTALAPDVCPVVAYGALIPPAVLAIPAHGWVNLHFSLLPRWRGAAPVQWALLDGDQQTGACTIELVPELDAGPVYRKLVEPIGELDTAGELLARLSHSGAELLADTLDDIAAGLRPSPQPDTGITLAPKITVADARLDWSRPAAQLARAVAATSPQPGAWTDLDGQHFKVLLARVAHAGSLPPDLVALTSAGLAPGELAIGKKQVLVGSGEGLLELLQVQPAGKKPMAAVDWARGVRLQQGSRFDQEQP